MDQIQYCYNRILSTDWTKNFIALLIAIGLLYLAFYIIRKSGIMDRKTPNKEIITKENPHSVTLDDHYLYAISNNSISKYRKKGKRVATKKLPFKNITNGKIVNGDLVLVNAPSNPEKNAVLWLDPQTLEIVDFMTIPGMRGRVSWIDWAWGKWWVCDIYQAKSGKESDIYCFNNNWDLEGFWKLPKQVIKSIRPDALAGGEWLNEYLCVSDDKEAAIYILIMPDDKVHAKLLAKVPICFDGGGFALAVKDGKPEVWGVKGDKLVGCELDLDSEKME